MICFSFCEYFFDIIFLLCFLQKWKNYYNGGDYEIGKYGHMRLAYLKEHRKNLYTNYVTEGTLSKHLSEIDQACNERMENIVSAMAKQEGVTEALKADDQMEWVRRMNNIRNRTEEIILREVVFV